MSRSFKGNVKQFSSLSTSVKSLKRQAATVTRNQQNTRSIKRAIPTNEVTSND